ncbi:MULTISPECIES: small membrane protein YldA [Citrobacter]|uniref:Small membrane protein YldA n=1 Tax=Citrobacter enshiensis TaxID=2971264 RepID=A0ABT8PPF8_9ENTR|nr:MULTISPECIES: small membrane protein YldA [Citrobacter]MDN8598123.1 small membrane protein YldA [Citrobacter enshiensis]WET39561.1 small membrane protein YldA [Citrobacter enshiensis]
MAEVLGITVVYILIAAILVAAVLFLEQHW